LKVTKWSTFPEILNVSEQQADPTGGESGSLGAGAAIARSSQAHSDPIAASAPQSVREPANIESPGLVPQQAPGAATAEMDAAKGDSPKAAAAKADRPRTPGKVMIMSAGDRPAAGADDARVEPETERSAAMFGKRRLAALAAVVALATITGALGGALATAGLGHFVGDDAASPGNRTFEASVARIDADILNLRLSLEHISKMGMSQFNRTSDRLDKIEKAQAEPAAKLAKLSEAVDKLRAAPPVAPVSAAAAQVAAKEVTGSIASAPPAADAAKAEVGRLPTVEGWVLRGVSRGVALIEGRRGIYEVYAGDAVPGAGRVDAIRRQDGHWVVVTSKGLIVGR
jgi:hypothetical protein